MTIARSRPQEIMSALLQNNLSMPIINRDIYNIREQLRQQNLAGRTPIQALINELKEEDYIYEYECDSAGCVVYLFFAHKESVNFTCQYSSVLLMDCTYRTNKFKMPLLNVVGITSLNTTFYSCFVFMKSEDEEDYMWALTHIIHLFEGISKPGIIVTDRELSLMNAFKPKFPKETEDGSSSEWNTFLAKWNEVVNSETEDEFNKVWQTFLVNQKNEIDSMVAAKRIHFPVFAHNNQFYANVRGKVSSFALKKINEEYKKVSRATVQNPLPPCSGSFSRTMGLPCTHHIQHLENSQGLILEDIHMHWWIQG
ncbi:10462_t:CDS:2 [Scutellospora calospora]|uniref:10462_t:CDS:1 n=1 Tax=Scutellospora calospora TaxID=85575 RepID=A0ACA9KLG8_9GLOM|nr:10462_t:CDS:2 [Scutellospora calospora]